MTRTTASNTNHTLDSWTTTKCQRLFRPLKLKILALEKALASSACVSNGLSSWAPRSHRTDARSEVSCDKPYLNSRPKTYGATRRSSATKKTHISSDDNVLIVDEVLASARHDVSPALGNAYIGVYYAFKTVLERTEIYATPKIRVPSLATSAASVVGHCIQLTSNHYTAEPIDASDWYDSVPGHFRSTVMLSYAVQYLVAAYDSLAPIMPAFALLLHFSPLAGEILDTLLEHTHLTIATKPIMRSLKSLALQIGQPWCVVQYYTDHFSNEYLYATGLAALIESTVEEPLHPVMVELYLKIYAEAFKVFQTLSHGEDLRKINKLQSLLQAMQRRILLTDDNHVFKLLLGLATNHRPGILSLSLGYALALLPSLPNDLHLLSTLERLTTTLQSLITEEKDRVMQHLTNAFPTVKLVEVIETLVGREDRLVSILAAECSIRLQGDFIDLANEIEKDVAESKSEDDDKYRFEPLLNSWVTRTPGVRNIRNVKRIIMDDSADEEDEYDEISHQSFLDEGLKCRLRSSGTTLVDASKGDEQSSTTSHEASVKFEGHQQSVPQSVNSVPPIVQRSLSIKRMDDISQSARLLQRYQGLSTKNVGLPSPLLRRTKTTSLDMHTLVSNGSPLCSTGLKRHYPETANSPAHKHNSSGFKRRRNCFGSPISAGLLADQFLSAKTAARTARKPLRELNNLKSSFATKRKESKVMTLRSTQSDGPAGEIDLCDTLRSEVDELSML